MKTSKSAFRNFNFIKEVLELIKYEIIGLVTTVKDGKMGTRLIMVSDFSDYVATNSTRCEGVDAIIEYTRLDCSNLCIGDTVELFYNRGFKNLAQLVGIKKIEE